MFSRGALNVSTTLFLVISLSLIYLSPVNANKGAENSPQQGLEVKTQSSLINSMKFRQAKGTFEQKKHFKFLTQPIRSSGIFVVDNSNVLWQTNTPVLSQLLVKKEGVFRRLSKESDYQALIENKEFSSVLTTILSGQFKPSEWRVDDTNAVDKNCLSFIPVNTFLSKIFKRVEVCLIDDKKRQILLVDLQGNKTEIEMVLATNTLSGEDLNSLDLNAKQE